ncbi:MAG TPA: phosphatase PAP2 family protein [Candidatus Limnocylindrales bacterium]
MSEPSDGQLSEHGPLGPSPAADPPATPPTPQLGLAAMTVVVGFFGLVASLVVLGSIAEGVRDQEVFALDTWATPFLHGIASPGLDAFMNGVTDIGSIYVIPVLFVAVVLGLIWRKRYRAAAFIAVASLGSLVLQASMKLFFARPRPQLPWAAVLPDYSFPSGHTMNTVIFYGAVALVIWSILGRRSGMIALGVAVILAFGVGVSRIYLGYHYLTDVVGGMLAGIAWLLVVGAAFRARPTWRRWRSPRNRPTPAKDQPSTPALH